MGKKGVISKVVAFAKDENVRFVTGILLLILSVYFTIAFFSFFSTGGSDYSAVNSPGITIGTPSADVQNPAGGQGARFANFVINDGFGVASIFLIFVLLLAGLKLMKVGKFKFVKYLVSCLLLTVWMSVFLSAVIPATGNGTFINYGGEHGQFISEWLELQIGAVGLWLLLVAFLIIIMIYISAGTIPLLKKLFTMPMRRKVSTESESGGKTVDIVDEKPAHKNVARTAKTSAPEVKIDIDVDSQDDIHSDVQDAQEEPERREDLSSVAAEAGDAPQLETIESSDCDMTIEVAKSDEVEVPLKQTVDIKSTEPYDPRRDLEYYKFPTLDLLTQYDNSEPSVNIEEQNENKNRIKEILRSFGIEICTIKATVGPTITLYEITPEQGVRISKIRGLEDDIALILKAIGVRIIAPIPGKGTIGIEVPNSNPKIVSMRSIIASKKFQESTYDLPVAFGRTITNEVFMVDLAKMPHILVAGATGQGKSVGLNAIITSLLYKKHPAELKFVMIDPKKVEFSIYSIIERHFLAKLPDSDDAIITDFTKVIHTLNSLCIEMDERYDLLKAAQVRNVKEYNKKFVSRQLNPEKGHRFMPYIVVVIDEFGDLIMQAGKDIEFPIARIAQLARAVGIHMIIATQRPTTQIITGNIKTNFPARVAFRVAQRIDSMTILDRPGANQLIGRGDMLFLQGNDPVRVQCAFVDTPEVENITSYIAEQQGYPTAFYLPEYVDENSGGGASADLDVNKMDSLFEDAARLVVIHQQGSTSLIQRKFSIGYNRAGRIMDQLERAGIVGAADGSKPRQVMCMDEADLQMKLSNLK